ncbi:MAG: DNA polymerase III subunit alpha [Alphaproteobacteria bacterium]|nr:DNA polymerase III subunit alpha [Alphaproteobacteria bacterium]
MTQTNFIHLHVHSAYSLAEGAIKVKDLIKRCRQGRMPAVAITDSNNLFGAMEFALEAAKEGIQPIIGAQVLVGDDEHQLVLLSQNETGYRNLCKLMSNAYLDNESQGRATISFEELKDNSVGLICLTGGSKGSISQSLVHGQVEQAKRELLFLKDVFGDRLYVELQRHGWDEENITEDRLVDLAYKHDIPLVATNDCYFTEVGTYEAHDALLCIAEGRYITEENRRKVTPEHYFKSEKEMVELFSDLPEAIQNTVVIAQRCSYLLKPIDPILPAYDTEGGRSEFEELKAQAEEGLKWRLEHFVKDSDHKPYFERLEFELGVINDMGFPGYFLIVSDFIKWAKDQNIPVGPGRGSGAGSVVAWALKITDLDPLEFNLLFERFLNPERVSMPDFDIDFCQDRREEVIHYVQEKYGYNRVAQIITFGKLQARAVVRDVGRVLQMGYGQVDRIAKMIPNNPTAPMTLQDALNADADLRAERDKDDTNKKLISIALQLEGLYRHASTHAAGVVIGDRDLHELVPLYRDPKSDMPVTQFNMKYVEQTGLVKFDFLGLKTMTVIQKTVELIKKSKNEDVDILQIPLDDEKTFEMLRRGENVGVFQMESAGMRDLGRQMKVSSFEQIIALVALYRPGPMENIPKYLACLRGDEERDYMHPKLQPYLEETYGIMIYQEQVMQAAQVLSGYTLGAADLLRRAMGKKIKSEMDAQRELFVRGAKEYNDVPEKQASHIFDQIAKFAGYGFNKAHSAGYALIAYWTAWLKANYPVEFIAASMTLDLGNTDKLSVFKQDIDRMGIVLYPPDINKSNADFAVEAKGVRYALAALKGVGESAMNAIVAERSQNGVYKTLDSFAQRLDYKNMNKRQFEQLSCAGAFDGINDNRAQMVGSSEIILRYAQFLAEERDSGQVSLFGEDDGDNGLGMPDLPKIQKWKSLEQLSHEFEAVGFYLSAHPLDSREQQFENLGISSIAKVEKDMQNMTVGHFQMAGVLLKKQEKMSQRGSKYAFLQLSDPTGIYEVTLFSELFVSSREYLEPGTSLLLNVNVEQREDQLRFTTQKIEPLEAALECKIREIQIHMIDSKPAQKIKSFLESEGKGIARVTIHIQIDEKRIAKIELPGRWSLGAKARNAIRAEDGVKKISEA